MNDTQKRIEFYKDKSIQSFLLCIEVFNKPTIDYRLEGCVFFLCNAWELLLKARLLSNGQSIYYPEKKGVKRSLSLSDAAARVMTNEKDPVRVNLKIIISLRNTATHAIIPEFEIVYVPFITFSARAYTEKMNAFFGIHISDYIKTDFLSLFANNMSVDTQQILSKYGEGIAISFSERVNELADAISSSESAIATRVEVNMVRVNNRSNADFLFYTSNNPKDQNVKYMDRDRDINVSHPLSCRNVVSEVDKAIKENHIPFIPIREPVPSIKNPNPNIFTTAAFDILCKQYRYKENPDYCKPVELGSSIAYKYSKSIITDILTQIMDDPEVVIKAKKKG